QPQPERKLVQPGEAKVWDVHTGQEIYDLPGHTKNVAGVAFSPDGKYLVTASWDRMVRVWDLANRKEMFSLGGHPSAVEDLAFREDGKRLATAGVGDTKIWDWPTCQEILSLPGGARGVSFLMGDKRLVTTSSSGVTIWDGTPLDEKPPRVVDRQE